jgi:ATP-dependent exoDNAse (exonuclease V) beta subunit
VTHSPLGKELLGSDNDRRHNLQSHVVKLSDQICNRGFGNCICEWVEILKPHFSTLEYYRLDKLTELAFVFESSSWSRLSDFEDLVRSSKVDDPAVTGLRVMTIHQAKGLDFDIVILPELDNNFFRPHDEILTSRSHPLDRASIATNYPNELVRSLSPELQILFDKNREKIVSDELAVLYVALTRARYATFALTKLQKKSLDDFPCSNSGILKASLLGKQTEDREGIVYKRGDKKIIEKIVSQ